MTLNDSTRQNSKTLPRTIERRLNRLPAGDAAYFIRHMVAHLYAGDFAEMAENFLTDFQYLSLKLSRRGVLELIEDFSYSECPSIGKIGRVLDLAAHILQQYPDQLYEQMYNRLWHQSEPKIRNILQTPIDRPWLKSLSANFVGAVNALIRTLNCRNEPVAGVVCWNANIIVAGTEEGFILYFETGSGKLLRRFRAHEAEIQYLFKCPVGIVTAAADGSVSLWQVPDGACLFTGNICNGDIRRAVVSSSGRYLVTCGIDGSCRLLDLADLTSTTVARTCAGYFTAVAISFCERILALAASDRTICLLRLPDGDRIKTVGPMSSSIQMMVFDEDGEEIIAGDKKGGITVLPVNRKGLSKRIYRHKQGICQLAIHASVRTLFSASENGEIIRWDLEKKKKRDSCFEHYGPVTAIQFSPEGKQFFTSGWDRAVRVWDMETGTQIGCHRGHSDEISTMDLDAANGILVSGSWDGTLRIWDPQADPEEERAPHYDEVSFIRFHRKTRTVVSASNDGRLKIHGDEDLNPLHTLEGHSHWVTHFSFYGDDLLLSASDDRTVRAWRISDGKCLSVLEGHEEDVIGVVPVNAMPGTALSHSLDGTMILWDLAKGCAITRFTEHTDGIWDLAVHPEKPLAVTASSDKTVKIWDLRRSSSLFSMKGHKAAVAAVALCPETMRAVSGDDRGEIIVWDIANGTRLHTLSAHDEDIHQLIVTSNEKHFIASADDHHISTWEIDTGKRISHFSVHREPGFIDQILLTAGDRRLLSCADNGGIHVWDWRTGTAIAAFNADVGIGSVDTSPDGHFLVAGDAAGRIHLFSLEGI